MTARSRLLRLLLLALAAGDVHAAVLIDQAEGSGVLDPLTAAIYRVQAVRNPELVPAQYREEPEIAVCGTPIVSAAGAMLRDLEGDDRRRLAKALTRPSRDLEQVTASGHFKVHYSLVGAGAVDDTDDDGNGVPDYVDITAAVLDSVWAIQVEQMGYPPPLSDIGFGGGDERDVYIVELGNAGVYGFTYPEDSSGFTTYSYMELDNNYTDPLYRETKGLDALRVSIAHEFFHMIHFTYYQGNETGWWREASATWIEDVIYPEVDDYLQYVPSFLLTTHRALDERQRGGDFRVYGLSLFAHFVDQRYGPDLIRGIWSRIGGSRSGSLEQYDRALRDGARVGLDAAVSEFALWNYFTGERQREGRFYAEGDKYVEVRPQTLDPELVGSDSGRVERLGAAYVSIPPRWRTGGLILETEMTRGSWTRQLVLVQGDSIEVRSPLQPTERVAAWDQYDEVVLILVRTDLDGFSFDFVVNAEYDPDLTDAVTPMAFLLRQNYPNPFLPGRHGLTRISFDLMVPAQAVRLAVYSLDGQLVWQRGPDSASARTHTWEWNGRNQAGKLVGPGTYYYLLGTEDREAVRSLSVVR